MIALVYCGGGHLKFRWPTKRLWTLLFQGSDEKKKQLYKVPTLYLFFSPKYADDIAVLHSSEEVELTFGNWGMVGGDTIVEHLHGKHLPRFLERKTRNRLKLGDSIKDVNILIYLLVQLMKRITLQQPRLYVYIKA